MINLNDVLLAMSNIPVDDPIAEIWGRGLQGGYKIIEYTGSLPITINANGDALIDYRIYGTDVGVGEPTENLYNKNDPDIVFSAYMDYYGNIHFVSYGNAVKVSGYIPINGGQTYTGTNLMDSGSGNYYAYYDTNKQLLNTGLVANNMVFNSPTNAAYIRTTLIHRNGEDIAMLVEGSTAPIKYIPYGYKLPMTVSVNYEYVFTGNESFYNSYGRYLFKLPERAMVNSDHSNTLCSHFPYGTGSAMSGTYSFFDDGITVSFGVANEYSTPSDFKQFLTDQYVAGTPVKLRYFLAPSYFPVYIGENQLDSVEGVADYVDKSSGKIVRRIKEYTFTGEEKIYQYSVGFYTGNYFLEPYAKPGKITTRFSHFTARSNTTLGGMYSPTFGDDCGCFREGTANVMLRSTANFTTVAECKAYFKAQYDNGTPVKMWYIVKTPIEEDPPVPLPEIPTIDGETVIDYDGDPKPSQMYVKYKGKAVH